MNISRSETLDFIIDRGELLQALKRAYPNEFMLQRIPSLLKGVGMSMTDKTNKLHITFTAETSPGEMVSRRLDGPGGEKPEGVE